MPSAFVEPFDFGRIFLNYFLGNQALFPFAYILILSLASAYFNISNTVFLILLALGSLIFGSYIGQDIYILVLFGLGFLLYKMFERIFK